jgi:hypothetical protein
MVVKLSNNVRSSLRTEVLSGSTTILLPVGHGARFPALGAGEYFYATIEDAAGNYEIVRVTARATDTLTATRGAEGTTARTFAAGSTIEMRVTAASVLDAAQDAADTVDLAQFSVTASAAEINILDGALLSTAELNILDGATLSTAELNILDGVTATTAELNILDGVTATTAELNVLDGIPGTLTATELGYVDGVTSAIQTQLDAKTGRTSATGAAVLPAGTTAERDGSPLAGYFRFNSTLNVFEGYNGSAWGGVGGATGGGPDRVFYENGQTVTTNYTITNGTNAMSAGPITINSGVTVTVGDGEVWTVV